MAFLLKLPFMNGMRYYKSISDTKSTSELLKKLKSYNKNKFMTLYMTVDLLSQHVETCQYSNCTCSIFKDYICKMLLDIIEFKNDTCNNSRCKICSCDGRISNKKRKRENTSNSNFNINYIFLLRYIEKIYELDEEYLKNKTDIINNFLNHKCSKNCDYPHCRSFKKFYSKMKVHIIELSKIYKKIPLDYRILSKCKLIIPSMKKRKI